MRLNKLLTTGLFFLFSLSIYAQSEIDFNGHRVYDFGFVKEGVKVTHLFEFENTGSDTSSLVLSRVKPSCGCTSPNWPRNPFAAGESGEIQVTYNSKGRVGKFYKYITVNSNAGESELKLIIKGVVVAKNNLPADSVTNSINSVEPNLVFDRSLFNIGKIEKGKQSIVELTVTNSGREAISLNTYGIGCGCVYTKSKIKILPNETKDLEMNYTAMRIGEQSDKLVLVTDEDDHPVYEVEFKADVVESLVEESILDDKNTPNGFGF